MFTVYDFVNGDVELKRMRFGWKASVERTKFSAVLVLNYTMLNFDWDSLKFLNEEVMGIFLDSASYKRMKARLARSMKKFGRLYFEASSISDMKIFVEAAGLKIDVDRLLEKKTRRKSDAIAEKIKAKPVRAIKAGKKPRKRRPSAVKRLKTALKQPVSCPDGKCGLVNPADSADA